MSTLKSDVWSQYELLVTRASVEVLAAGCECAGLEHWNGMETLEDASLSIV
jgi:hypothetical protein